MNNGLPTALNDEAYADLESAARYAASGKRDPEVMRQACERMDARREELRRQIGEVDFAVELVREARDES